MWQNASFLVVEFLRQCEANHSGISKFPSMGLAFPRSACRVWMGNTVTLKISYTSTTWVGYSKPDPYQFTGKQRGCLDCSLCRLTELGSLEHVASNRHLIPAISGHMVRKCGTTFFRAEGGCLRLKIKTWYQWTDTHISWKLHGSSYPP